MKIKVCGLTSVDQMQALADLDIHYAGMIFYEKSKRYVGDKGITEMVALKALSIPKVGVFVSAPMPVIEQAISDYGLSAVQLHGDEDTAYCSKLMDKVQVIKVFRIADQQEIDSLVAPFHEACHFYLFDTDTASYGGSGQQFDWSVLEKANINKPFFLSGGIGLEDVSKVRAFRHPYFYGVDVNSRFETAPGVKDLQQVAAFKRELIL